MAGTIVRFPTVAWAEGSHPLEKKKTSPDGSVTLLSFAPGFADTSWCARGHSGYVLSGRLTFEMENALLEIGAGEGFVIDVGSLHRASNRGAEEVILFIVSSPTPVGA